MFNSCDEPGVVSAVVTDGDQPEPATQSANFAPQSRRVTGVDVRSLQPGTEVVVDTRNSHYRFVTLDGSGCNALVQGGRYFVQEATARIEGSTVGGSLLKIGWIGLGLFLELSYCGKHIVTSRVRSIGIDVSSATM